MIRGRGEVELTERETSSFEIRRLHIALLVCFFLSGATGLVYEVVWTRMAGLVFGNTVYAVTTVLAAFFSGLALGSYLLGPIADRAKRHVHLYGVMEIGIGLYGLCTPLLFGLVETVYLTAYQAGRENLLVFTLFQFLLVFLILVVPTTLMGGTLPILSRYFVRGEGEIGYGVGAIYALNTAGAVVGTIGAGFFLLPVMGVVDAIWLTAILNIGIGLLSVAFSRRLPEFEAAGIIDKPHRPLGYGLGVHTGPERVRLIAIVPVVFAISGGASMIYEIAWTRALALILGSSVYAFTTMLATFLIGLAGGSYVFSRLFRHKEKVDTQSFGWLEICIGISSLLILPLFDQLPNLFLRLAGLVSFSFGGLQLVQFVLSFLVMLVPTLLIGATFPCVVKICTRNIRHLGGNVGRLYAINTCGSIIGSFLGGFFLIPWMGAQNALTLAASLNLALGAVLVSSSLMRERAWRARVGATMACGAIILAFLIPRWDSHLMASGVAIYGQRYLAGVQGLTLNDLTKRWDLLFFKEGLNATISVHQLGKKRILKTNGKTDAGNDRDMHTQLMSGHLPLFLHPRPKKVLIIGLGSGVTAGAVAQHPVEVLEAVEIEPAVVEAAAFFSPENHGVLQDPRLRMVIGDGRNFLLSTPQSYDVIISEPSNPWIAGVANLFTLEFYRAARAKLRPGGLMCQWIQVYGIQPHDLRMVIKTFRAVFPHATIWLTRPGDLLLMGTPGPLTVDLARWRQAGALPGVMGDLRTLGFDSPGAVLADFILGEKETEFFAQNAALNTDNLPLLEFSAPRSLYMRTADYNQALAESYRVQEFPPVTGVEPGLFSSAQFRYQLGKAQWLKGEGKKALRHLDLALAGNRPHVPSLLLRAELRLQRGLPLQALADLETVLEREPQNAQALLKMGMVYYRQRLPQRAKLYLRKAVAAQKDLAEAHYLLGEVLMAEGRVEEAKEVYQRAVDLHPHNASFWARLAQALFTLEAPSEAIESYRKAIALDNNPGGLYLGLARALDQAGQEEEAFRQYQEAIHRDPRLSAAYIGLADYYLRRQQRQNAVGELVKGVTMNPGDVSLMRHLDRLLSENL